MKDWRWGLGDSFRSLFSITTWCYLIRKLWNSLTTRIRSCTLQTAFAVLNYTQQPSTEVKYTVKAGNMPQGHGFLVNMEKRPLIIADHRIRILIMDLTMKMFNMCTALATNAASIQSNPWDVSVNALERWLLTEEKEDDGAIIRYKDNVYFQKRIYAKLASSIE